MPVVMCSMTCSVVFTDINLFCPFLIRLLQKIHHACSIGNLICLIICILVEGNEGGSSLHCNRVTFCLYLAIGNKWWNLIFKNTILYVLVFVLVNLSSVCLFVALIKQIVTARGNALPLFNSFIIIVLFLVTRGDT